MYDQKGTRRPGISASSLKPPPILRVPSFDRAFEGSLVANSPRKLPTYFFV